MNAAESKEKYRVDIRISYSFSAIPVGEEWKPEYLESGPDIGASLGDAVAVDRAIGVRSVRKDDMMIYFFDC